MTQYSLVTYTKQKLHRYYFSMFKFVRASIIALLLLITFSAVSYCLGNALHSGNHEVVDFPDDVLELAIRDKLNIYNRDIYVEDLANLVTLEMYNTNIVREGYYNQVSDLSGLEHCVNLEKLSLSGEHITDLSALRGLTELRSISICGDIQDISPLSNLTKLHTLALIGNDIDDISVLANLTNLEHLFLSANNISDIYPLNNMHKLRVLCLENNLITDISPLKYLCNLEQLSISNNLITDISPLSGLTRLVYLGTDNNLLEDNYPQPDM